MLKCLNFNFCTLLWEHRPIYLSFMSARFSTIAAHVNHCWLLKKPKCHPWVLYVIKSCGSFCVYVCECVCACVHICICTQTYMPMYVYVCLKLIWINWCISVYLINDQNKISELKSLFHSVDIHWVPTQYKTQWWVKEGPALEEFMITFNHRTRNIFIFAAFPTSGTDIGSW